MMEHGRYTDLEEYIRQGEPDKKKRELWEVLDQE